MSTKQQSQQWGWSIHSFCACRQLGLLGHPCFVAATLSHLSCCSWDLHFNLQWRVVGLYLNDWRDSHGFSEPNADKVLWAGAGLEVQGPWLSSLFLEMAHLPLCELNLMLNHKKISCSNRHCRARKSE